jgi:hypothetical protein
MHEYVGAARRGVFFSNTPIERWLRTEHLQPIGIVDGERRRIRDGSGSSLFSSSAKFGLSRSYVGASFCFCFRFWRLWNAV